MMNDIKKQGKYDETKKKKKTWVRINAIILG